MHARGRSKVLVLGYSFFEDRSMKPTGASLQTMYVAKALAESGYEVHFIAFTKDASKAGRILEEYPNLFVHYFAPLRIDILNMFRILPKLVRMDYQFVYQRGRSWLTFLGMFLSKLKKAKFVWASSAQEGLERYKHVKHLVDSNRSLWKKIILMPLMFLTDILTHLGMKYADVILVQNEFQKREAYRIWRREAHIVPNIQPDVPKYPNKEEPPKVVWVGNLIPWKRPHIFLEIAKRMPEVTFIMVGDGDRKLIRGYDRIGNLEYMGRLSNDEVNELLEDTWFIVNTSRIRSEGVPNSIIQAMMRGNVAISMNEDYGILDKVGFVVRSVDEVVEVIGRLIMDRDEYLRLSRASYELSNELFGYSKVKHILLKHFVS